MDIADAVAAVITMLGHIVDVAYDGETALWLFDDRHHNLVLFDLELPGMDGYAIARDIRRRSGTATKLIAVSGRTSDPEVKKALSAGFDECVAKPIQFGQIEMLLDALN